jgi:hypothetical protein
LHSVDFTEELFIDNFLNDEHRRYLQYFQANPTTIYCVILQGSGRLFKIDLFLFILMKNNEVLGAYCHAKVKKRAYQGTMLNRKPDMSIAADDGQREERKKSNQPGQQQQQQKAAGEEDN